MNRPKSLKTKTCFICGQNYCVARLYKRGGAICSPKCHGVMMRLKYASGELKVSGHPHSLDSKKKISEKMMGNRNANHRGDRQSYYNNTRFDSSWEVGVARWFDSKGIVWSYGKIQFKLSNGKTYLPDFAIMENEKIVKFVEVKGYFREQNRLKFEMFKLEHPEIVIELWEKNKLIELGITNSSGYLN